MKKQTKRGRITIYCGPLKGAIQRRVKSLDINASQYFRRLAKADIAKAKEAA